MDNINSNSIILGTDPNNSNIIVMYEATEVNFSLLSSIAKLLIPILIGAGLRALIDFVNGKEFQLKYPGGKIKIAYNNSSEESEDKKSFKLINNLILENILD